MTGALNCGRDGGASMPNAIGVRGLNHIIEGVRPAHWVSTIRQALGDILSAIEIIFSLVDQAAPTRTPIAFDAERQYGRP